MTASSYDRPVLPWLFAVGSYALVGGLIVLLSHTVYRSSEEAGRLSAGDRERISEDLEELRDEAPLEHTPSFDRFITKYLLDPRVLYCPEIDAHRDEDYWPESTHPADDMAYCYVSGLSTKVKGNWVVAYDERWNHLDRGANVLSVGGQVEWVEDYDEIVSRVHEQLGSRRLLGQDAGVCPPWWSRAPQRPSFMTARTEEQRSSVWPVIVGSLALAAGVVAFARLAKSSWASVKATTRRSS